MAMATGQCIGQTECHHIRSRKAGGDDRLENLVTLCGGHHTLRGDSIHRLGPRRFLLVHVGKLRKGPRDKIKAFLVGRGLIGNT